MFSLHSRAVLWILKQTSTEYSHCSENFFEVELKNSRVASTRLIMGVASWLMSTAETQCDVPISEDIFSCTIATDGAIMFGLLSGAITDAVAPLVQNMYPKGTIREHRMEND